MTYTHTHDTYKVRRQGDGGDEGDEHSLYFIPQNKLLLRRKDENKNETDEDSDTTR